MVAGQDEKPGVVGQKGAASAALLGGPADELITAFEVSGGGTPTGQGQPLPAEGGHVAELFTHQLMGVQIVVRLDEPIVAAAFLGLDQANRETIEDLLFLGQRMAESGRRHRPTLKNRVSVVPPIIGPDTTPAV